MNRTNGRQRRAEGSIEARPDGTWRIFVSAGEVNGRRRRVSEIVIGNRWDANRRLSELAQAIRTGAYAANGAGQTLGQFVAEWWPSKAASLAPRTAEGYRDMLDRHVLPALGKKRLQRITSGDVSALVGGLVDSGTVTQAVHVHRFTKTLFNEAMRAGVFVRNPGAGVARPRLPHREMQVIGPEEWQKARDYLSERRSWALLPLTVTITTGLRRSEVLGLQWVDINFDRAVLSVRRTVHNIQGKGIIVGHPKSHRSARAVALDQGTLATLADHLQDAKDATAMLGRRFSETAFVFCRYTDGSPWRPNSLTHVWVRAAKACGVTGRLHDLRHTTATIMLSRGIPVRLVSERLGHASAGFTLSVYAHTLPGAQAAAAEDLARILAGEREPEALPAG